jgi:hypothetical protein
MPHALAQPRVTARGPETPLQAWIVTDFAERFDVIARKLGVPKSRLAGEVIAAYVTQFELDEHASLLAMADNIARGATPQEAAR